MSRSIGRAFWNTVLQTGNAFLSSGLNFLVIVALTHFLGTEGFGEYVGSQAKVAVWILLVDLGLMSGAISALTDLRRTGGDAGTGPVLWRILFIRTLGAGLGLGLITALAWGTPTFARDLAFAPYLFGYGLQQTLNTHFLYRNRQDWCVGAHLVGLVLTSLIAVFCAYRQLGVGTILFVQSLAPFASTVALLFGLPSTRAPEAGTAARPAAIWSALLANSWPYALIFASTTLWQRLDQLVAAHGFTLAETGEYGLAARLVGIPILMTSAVSIALFPDFQRVGADAPEKVSFYVGMMLKVLLRYGIALAALVLIGMAFVLSWIFPKFSVALHLIPWFVPGIWAYWMFNFANNALLGLRGHKAAVLAHLGGAAVYGLALYALPPLFGLRGIALSYDLFCVTLFVLTYLGLASGRAHGIPAPWSPLSLEEKGALTRALRASLRMRNA